MRRLFGPRGGAVKKDALARTGVDVESGGDFAARIGRRGAKKENGQFEGKRAEGGRNSGGRPGSLRN